MGRTGNISRLHGQDRLGNLKKVWTVSTGVSCPERRLGSQGGGRGGADHAGPYGPG